MAPQSALTHHVGVVGQRSGCAALLLHQLEEDWQVNNVFFLKAQLSFQDVPVPVHTALRGDDGTET